MKERESIRVLLIEDDEDDYFIARRLLSKTTSVDCELSWVDSYEEGLDRAVTNVYDVCLVDYRLGAHDGLELLRTAAERGCDSPMILLTGQGDLQVDLDAMMAGAVDYLVKGQIDAPLLERAIRYARERKRAERRIREQADLLDKARDAICAFDLNRQVVYWNKSAERLTGWTAEEMRRRPDDRCLYDDGYEKYDEAWSNVLEEGDWVGDLKQVSKGGRELVVESRWTLVRDGAGRPQSVLVINTDVTERKKLESQFLRAQRMESIGNLISGIAHDLGNLLVPILLGVKVLRQKYGDDAKTAKTLEMIGRSAQRGSDMVQRVLAFARGVEGQHVDVAVAEVINEVEKISNEAFSQAIDVSAEVEDHLWPLNGDPTQLQQVLMNLCVNARDAMPDGGSITIRARNIEIGEHMARANIDAKPGRYVLLDVEDTGSGIPSEELDRIFEPFFTTKPTGKGTGLGLSTVYTIVKSHEGFIDVESEVGRGTRFKVYLPIASGGRAATPERRTEQPREGRGEIVLVVDDESDILLAATETLESSGYRVLTARNGSEALTMLQDGNGAVDVVLTDLMMPEVDGVEVIRVVRRDRPHVPIIAASGVAGAKVDEALAAGANVFISKPFTAEKLMSSLQEAFSAAGDVEG